MNKTELTAKLAKNADDRCKSDPTGNESDAVTRPACQSKVAVGTIDISWRANRNRPDGIGEIPGLLDGETNQWPVGGAGTDRERVLGDGESRAVEG